MCFRISRASNKSRHRLLSARVLPLECVYKVGIRFGRVLFFLSLLCLCRFFFLFPPRLARGPLSILGQLLVVQWLLLVR